MLIFSSKLYYIVGSVCFKYIFNKLHKVGFSFALLVYVNEEAAYEKCLLIHG